jgi:hypothetical protein
MAEESCILKAFNEFKKEGEPLLEEISKRKNLTVIPILFHIQVGIVPWVVTKIYDRLIKFGNKIKGDVAVILFSRGGDPDTAFHIGKMLSRMTEGRLIYIVPRLAGSAATLLTLSGDRIVMGPPSELSPIDPQIEISPDRFISARTAKEACDLILKEILKHPEIPKSTVEALLEAFPLRETVDYESLLEHMVDLATSLLKLRMVKNEEIARQIAEKLVKGYKYHGRSITIDDALELGLCIEELPHDEWIIVWQFHKKWEEVAKIIAKEGAPVLDLDVGNGVAFVPVEAESEHEERPLLQSVLESMWSFTKA